MNAFSRFITLGLQDADRRVAAMLKRPPLEETDRYLRGSVVVSTIDRIIARLHVWWTASAAGRLQRRVIEVRAGQGLPQRAQSIGAALLTAAMVHIALVLLTGPRPGWFWMVIPSLALFASALLVAASRSTE